MAKATDEFTTTTARLHTRGRILDRNGAIIASSLPTYFCSVMKNEVKNPQALIRLLSASLSLDETTLNTNWNRATKYLKVAADITPEAYLRLTQSLEKDRLSEGVRLDPAYSRYYHYDAIARDLLGDVDRENNGKSGLELIFNDILSGEIPKIKVIRDRSGGVIESESSKDAPREPLDLQLTIDSRIQNIAESALDTAIKETQAIGGLAIIQDPYTGDILASVSRPLVPGYSRAFQWTYEPGSTFKSITLSAALENKVIVTKDSFDCENGQWNYFDKPIYDDEKEGVLSVPEILIKSSNIGSAKIALKLGIEKFYSHMRAYGFGSRTTICFPGESNGLVKPMATSKSLDLAINAFGYGISVTGIQLVGAYSALANGGVLMEPRLIRQITHLDGAVVSETQPAKIRKVISEQTATLMREMLEGVVMEGTGKKAQIPGYPVAGKTGTSKKLTSSGKYAKDKFVASFCAFVPARKPAYTILVVIDEPKTQIYGGQAAAPAFKQIASNLLSINAIAPTLAPPEKNKKDRLGQPQGPSV